MLPNNPNYHARANTEDMLGELTAVIGELETIELHAWHETPHALECIHSGNGCFRIR